jgi:hypothetical protein
MVRVKEILAYFKIACRHSVQRLDKATKNPSQLTGNPTEIRNEYFSTLQA